MKRFFQFLVVLILVVLVMLPINLKAATPLPDSRVLTEEQIKAKTTDQQFLFLLEGIEDTYQYYFINSNLTETGKEAYNQVLEKLKNTNLSNYLEPVEYNISDSVQPSLEEIADGVKAFLYDYKLFFWHQYDINVKLTSVGSKHTVTVNIMVISIYTGPTGAQTLKEDLEELLINREKIKGLVLAERSRYHQIKVIHDWLVINNKYNTSYDQNVNYESNTPVGALVSRYDPVCEAYSEGFLLLANYVNIPAVYGTGTATNSSGSEAHAWNYVQIGGKWYFLDATWDDPLPDRGSNVSYEYFLTTIPNSHVKDPKEVLPTPFTTEPYKRTMNAEFIVTGNSYYYKQNGNPIKGYDTVKISSSSSFLDEPLVTYYDENNNKLPGAPSQIGKYKILFTAPEDSIYHGEYWVYFEIAEQTYTVNFYNFEHILIDTQHVKHGLSGNAPDVPRDGYKLVGWDKDFSNVVSDLDIYPEYEPITIKFYNLNGEELDTTLPNNKAIEVYNTPTDEQVDGKLFVGWANNGVVIKKDDILTTDLELKPVFEDVTIDKIKGASKQIDTYVISKDLYDKEEIILDSTNQYIISQEIVNEPNDKKEYTIKIVVGSYGSTQQAELLIKMRLTDILIFGLTKTQLIIVGSIIVVSIILFSGVGAIAKRRKN